VYVDLGQELTGGRSRHAASHGSRSLVADDVITTQQIGQQIDADSGRFDQVAGVSQ